MQRNVSGLLPDGSVTDIKLSTALRQTLQRKNFLKNPNFAVIQGTASGTIANSLALPTASLGYLGETEWWLAASGGTPAYAFSQLNENVTFTGAAGTTAIHLGQRIESRDANKLKNKTVTLSAEISNSLLTTVTWELFNPTTTDDIHGTVAAPSQTLIATGTFTVSPTLTRYSATTVLPVGVSRGLAVRFRVGAQTSGTWVVSRLQLEEGSLATNFVCDDVAIERLKCQRYYRKTNLDASVNTSNDGNNISLYGNAGGVIATRTLFDQEMFDAPVITTWDLNGNVNCVLTTSSGGVITTRVPIVSSSRKRIAVAAVTSDVLIEFNYTASAHIP